ncbi:MAG: hypothetical protein H2069_04095 [Legionella sp.]|nr:hypothetical protein [Legionella sp.]
MAICLFTKKHFDGSGDVVQSVKIADFIQTFVEKSKSKLLQDESTIIVVEDDKNKAIATHFISALNPKVQVKKLSELTAEKLNISCCIEAGYTRFNWEKELSFKGKKPPLVFMPEYDNDVSRRSPEALKILGGFDKSVGDVGVIPSVSLLSATADPTISKEGLHHAFEKLDTRLKKYLGKDFEDFQVYRKQHNFTYQYSHDRNSYPTFFANALMYLPWDLEEEVTQGREYSPVQFFFQEHIMLTGNTSKSQDVLCIGENPKSKIDALISVKEMLIAQGYTKISFIDIESGSQQIIYENGTEGAADKEYRVLYSKSMPFSTMQKLPLIANDIVGVTGDQSLVEAMSANKLVSYECVSHKKDFAKGYLKAVQQEISSGDYPGTSNLDVELLARFLIKPTYRCDNVEYKSEEVARLLSDKKTVNALKKINRRLVEQSQYFASIEKILRSEVIPYLTSQRNLNNSNQKIDHIKEQLDVSSKDRFFTKKMAVDQTSNDEMRQDLFKVP